MTSLFSSPERQLRPLRPHQERAIEALRESLRGGHKRPMLQLPTAGGKTIIAANILRNVLARGKQAIFCVPCLSLVDQTADAFEAEGLTDIGVMQATHHRTDSTARLQIASVQTLIRRKLPPSGLVIIDEAHLQFDSLNQIIANEWVDIPVIGLSATPWSKGLGKTYDDLIIVATIAELIEAGYLSKFTVYAPSEPDLSGVHTERGDFHQGELAQAVDKPPLIGDAIETWQKLGEDRQTIAYAVSRAHAKHLQERFEEVGVHAGYIDAHTERADREKLFEAFRRKEIRILCNVGCLTTGLDLDVRCIVDCKPTKSDSLFIQTFGRGLRVAPGKDRLLYLDHSGNALRLGLPTDIDVRHTALDCGKPRGATEAKEKEKIERPVLCDDCKTVMPPRAEKCPTCGKARVAKSSVIVKDGDLVEMGAAQKPKPRTIAERDKVVFYSELLFLSAHRGYSRGWVAHKFKEKFGHWPDGPLYRQAYPEEASLATIQWVRSRSIAFAKSKGARRHG